MRRHVIKIFVASLPSQRQRLPSRGFGTQRFFRRRLSRRRGFTLVESLAAFAILTAVLAQLLQGVSGAARNEARADFLIRAARQGASQLETLGADGGMPVGVTSGRYDDGLIWRLDVALQNVIKGPPGAPTTSSYVADLAISRPDGNGALTLSTVKIISAPSAAGGFQ